MKVHGY